MFAIYMLVFYSHEETGRLTVWQMESKTRYLKILLRNRVYRLHKFISFTDNCRENKTKFFFFTITERILARWLVKSDGRWEYLDHGNDITCHAVSVVLFLVFRKKINVIVKNKSTTIFHGLQSIEMTPITFKITPITFKTLQWNHSPAARGSTRVLNILLSHFYGV